MRFQALIRRRLKCIRSRSEGNLVSYLSRSVQNSYIRESASAQRGRRFIPQSAFEEEELYALDAAAATDDTYFAYEFPGIERILTKPETSLIQMIYITGYSACEAAHRLGVSRQAANQMKNRALKKLKNQFADKP